MKSEITVDTGHAYTKGDLVYINGSGPFIVCKVTNATTFTIKKATWLHKLSSYCKHLWLYCTDSTYRKIKHRRK